MIVKFSFQIRFALMKNIKLYRSKLRLHLSVVILFVKYLTFEVLRMKSVRVTQPFLLASKKLILRYKSSCCFSGCLKKLLLFSEYEEELNANNLINLSNNLANRMLTLHGELVSYLCESIDYIWCASCL